MAEKVKEKYAKINDLDYNELLVNRELKVDLAQNEKKEKGEDIWVRYLQENIDKSFIYIIPDCRFLTDVKFHPQFLIRLDASDERGFVPNDIIDNNIMVLI